MSNPRQYHGLLIQSAKKGDQQTFVSVAAEYFVKLGEQIIQNLLYHVQHYNAISKRIWLFGFALAITLTASATVMQSKGTLSLPSKAPLIAMAISAVLIAVPLFIINGIKGWLYHLMRKTESIMKKRSATFANEAWETIDTRGNIITQIENTALQRYEKIIRGLKRFKT